MNDKNTKYLIKAYPEIFTLPKHDGPQEPFALFYFECGDGWFNLLVVLCEGIKDALSRTDSEFRKNFYVTQVKEKFGGLRFYISYGNDEIFNLIDEAEETSAKTCELCGKPGKTNREGHWLSVRCNKCREEQEKRRNENL